MLMVRLIWFGVLAESGGQNGKREGLEDIEKME